MADEGDQRPSDTRRSRHRRGRTVDPGPGFRGVRSVRRQSGRSCWAAGLFDRRAADISDRAGDLRDLYAQLFVGRLLGVEPLEQPEEIITISPLDIGNLIHYSMDEFIRDRAASLPTFGAPWTADLDSMLDGRQRLARRARRAGGGQRIDLRHEGFRACRRRGAAGSGAEVGSRIGPIWAD